MSDTANQDKFADALESMMLPGATVQLTKDTEAALKEIARKRGLHDIGEALLQAIGDELVLAQARAEGSRVYIERPNKKIHEIILR